MKLILINPLWAGACAGLFSLVNKKYPAFFSVLKALTPRHWKVKEINCPFNVSCHGKMDSTLVAISCYSANAYRAYAIAKKYRKAGAKVVIGGPHVSFALKEALCFCDSVVIGEAEGIWEDLLNDFENNKLKKSYGPTIIENYGEKTSAEFLKIKELKSAACLESSRGCKFKCDFCAIGNLYQGKVRSKDIKSLIEQIKYIAKKTKRICFVDSNIFSEPAFARQLFEALSCLKLKWSAECSIDVANQRDDLKLLKKSGCKTLAIGYESISYKEKNQRNGKFALISRYIELSKKLKSKGIKIKAQFIYGFDGDNFKNTLSTYYFLAKLNPSLIAYSFLTPYKSTELYRKYLKEGRIINLNWKKYDRTTIVFKTNNSMPVCLEQILFLSLFRFLSLFLFSGLGRVLALSIIFQISIVAMLCYILAEYRVLFF